MQFQLISLLALAGAVAASAPEKRQQSSEDPAVVASIYKVLLTVLPSDLLSLAITNPGAVATAINSEIEAGQATWFTALPTDVQSYLISVGESQYSLTAETGLPASTGSAASTAAVVTAATTASVGTITAAASTNGTTLHSATLSSTHSGAASGGSSASSASGASAASSSRSTGAASLPTAVVGAGIAAAAGVLGMLAL